MNCDGVRGLLSAYVDGELSAGELLRVEQHLRRCHACADEVDSLRQMIALVSSLDEVEVPATFHAQLHGRLVALGPPVPRVAPMPAAPSWQRGVRRWAVPAAAAAAALVIGVSTLQQAPVPGAATPSNQVDQPQVASNTPNPGGSQSTTPVAEPGGSNAPQPTGGDNTTNPGPDKSSGGSKDNVNGSTTGTQPQTNVNSNGGSAAPSGGAHVVTDPGAVTVVTAAERKTVAYTLTISGVSADKQAAVLAELQAQLPGSAIQADALQVSMAKELVQAKAREIAAKYPGAQVKDQSQNMGPEYQQALDRLQKAQSAYDKFKDSTVASGDSAYTATLAAKQQDVTDAQSDLQRIERLLQTGILRIEFAR